MNDLTQHDAEALAVVELLKAECFRKFGTPAPPGLYVENTYDIPTLVRKYRIKWTTPEGWMYFTYALDAGMARMGMVQALIDDPNFSAAVYATIVPFQVAQRIVHADRRKDTRKIHLVFANGHRCSIDDRQPLSDFDHANLLMVYNLPPL